jgi:GrpB-like predicted nucleotidyltransferase (UPF0157 family)
MSEHILVAPYDPEWPNLFQSLGRQLRTGLQELADRIDHIGSTSISGMAAKPIVDIQISVPNLEPIGPYKAVLESLGFVWQPDNPDLTKRYFREGPVTRRTHIHVRQSGSWGEQFALLFRDYLRTHSEDAVTYAKLKYELAVQYQADRKAYLNGKASFIWAVMQRATDWSQVTGWHPGDVRRLTRAWCRRIRESDKSQKSRSV